MGLFAKSGVVYLFSKTDKRWNVNEDVDHVPIGRSKWHEDKVAELTKKYGPPPDDLEFGGYRD